ncbi:hypothetical protein B0G57_110166 [Trinickia symbiotica]|uniref:Glycosyl hydrolase family 32 N-terminal domain-containing protein n=1 Tax=Trinickia symbiotica TaxID=863227 RepID=A0A2N7X797_9BURK|nr:hypothetical protein [Trinickia symbiotica]PMS37504.1 hypothetical protein C0Z20_05895 [Trinickia symbiotica]PPK44092.1 hypothetical protein B0G57_110166 [Trinickia symbiotica]
MKWEKLGLVCTADRFGVDVPTRVMVPTPVFVNEDTIRVFVTVCDKDNIGRPYYVDVDARDPRKVLRLSERPVMDVGTAPSFDEHGVVVAQVLKTRDGKLQMYYSGFERFRDVRYKIFTGLATSSNNGESFQRVKTTPILGGSDYESTFRCAPFVIEFEDRFSMWYVAGSSWETIRGKQVPRYSLKYLESPDGIEWPVEGRSCMELQHDEHGFGRPWIEIDEHGTYHLYYSIRVCSLAAYRLGYATSEDGLNWVRKDAEMGLEPTPGSFDSNGLSYSAIIEAHGSTYCFYNGNDFGREGFAVSKLIK